MSYTVESTEAFEKEFSRNHKDKKEWMLLMAERLEQKPQSGKPLKSLLYYYVKRNMQIFAIFDFEVISWLLR